MKTKEILWLKAICNPEEEKKMLWRAFETNKTEIWTILLLQVASVVSDSVQPHRRQPTRLPRLWDSPGKNIGVGCHFLLHAWKWKVKVKSLSRVRLCATPWTAAYQAPPSMEFSRQEYWSGVPLPSPCMLMFLHINPNHSSIASSASIPALRQGRNQ